MTNQVTPATVFVIEDDESVRMALDGLFRSVGLNVALYRDVSEFVAADTADHPGCLVLDVRLPGRNGIDFYEDLVSRGTARPAVFISGHADVPMSVRAMKAGAIEFLTKPVRDQDLLDAVHAAIAEEGTRRQAARAAGAINEALTTLSTRERAILDLVVSGLRNKQIAAAVGLSEATVKLHRGNVMHKMKARSFAELVRMTAAIEPARPSSSGSTRSSRRS